MGDIKRLEALDLRERAVLVAMRQGGLEVVDLGDALLKPADKSRTILPHYNPPQANINRRAPFVWKIGSPIVNVQLDELMTEDQRIHSKYSTGSKRVSSGKSDSISSDFDMDSQDEVFFFFGEELRLYR